MNRYNVTSLISQLELFFAKYIAFAEPIYSLPLALWVLGTFMFADFDAYPYLIITSATKRSGKTRLSELLSFTCSNPRQFAAMTPAGVFHSIDQEQPTLFFDEAEVLSSEAASTMRAVLNVGYRKGQYVPRIVNGNVKEFPTYCPKVFVLIGDTYETLMDRSIVVRMTRGEPKERFLYEHAKAEGAGIREQIAALFKDGASIMVSDTYAKHAGLPFLTDRDEEIWTALFSVAAEFCPERLAELQAASVDIATEKTSEARRYINLLGKERAAEDDEYAVRLLRDVHALLEHKRHMGTKALLDLLRELPTSPWRKFRGKGLSVRNLSDMLSRFNVTPLLIRTGEDVMRGYRFADVDRAFKKL